MSGKKPAKGGEGGGMSRREFLYLASFFPMGMGIRSLYSHIDFFRKAYDFRNLDEELPTIKIFDEIDRKGGKKFPSLDVYKALCSRKNYERMGQVLWGHYDNMIKMGFPCEEVNRNEAPEEEIMRECIGIISEITGSRTDKEPVIESLENRARTYGFAAASAGGIAASYLVKRHQLLGKGSEAASNLLSLSSGASFFEALESYIKDEKKAIAGQYADGTGKVKLKESKKRDVTTHMHEGAHFVFDQEGASEVYGCSINEGFASGIELLGSRIYDRRSGTTNYELSAESGIFNIILPLYDYISESQGYPQPDDFILFKKLMGVLFANTDKRGLDHHNLGYSLFQVLEKEHGQEIYRQILRKEDGIFEDFIYRGK
jgi:hypothetical protein